MTILGLAPYELYLFPVGNIHRNGLGRPALLKCNLSQYITVIVHHHDNGRFVPSVTIPVREFKRYLTHTLGCAVRHDKDDGV